MQLFANVLQLRLKATNRKGKLEVCPGANMTEPNLHQAQSTTNTARHNVFDLETYEWQLKALTSTTTHAGYYMRKCCICPLKREVEISEKILADLNLSVGLFKEVNPAASAALFLHPSTPLSTAVARQAEEKFRLDFKTCPSSCDQYFLHIKLIHIFRVLSPRCHQKTSF